MTLERRPRATLLDETYLQCPGRPRLPAGVPALAGHLDAASTTRERRERVTAALQSAGFDWLAYGQLVRSGQRHLPRRWYVGHAHRDWMRERVEEHHDEADPRLQDTPASCSPVPWDLDQLTHRLAVDGSGVRGHRLVAGLRACGMASGVWWAVPDATRPDHHTVICLDSRTAGTGWITAPVLGQALVIALSVHEFLSTHLPPLAEPAEGSPLSATQQGVLDCLREGHSDKVIADRLHLSSHAVDYHMRQLRRRFAVRNRVELVHAATASALQTICD